MVNSSIKTIRDPRTVLLTVLIVSFGIYLSVGVVKDPRTVLFTILVVSYVK